ncbi:pyridoxal phosphate-dependent aminotransferase [Rubrivirga sp. S365]|uniref:Aminotransferase n=1 Tax=Rubrivirga litoralis TaxID=3075598 RepID=A0ABU3BSF9_9BACT|nr:MULTISPECIES: pyridoxal phosphate-dependent aminotransferase [unclassified Rubrivirga]MDT0632106.1 pyridoxal phosphate-dependent aminotransferase [Rubrivirga sp. F394]MDT7856184.1 pyridoxal phosphate-dependent aminotransferase [Rubrivirga sp. S365]
MTAPPLDALNPNVAAMRPSATLAISARASALRREGRDVIALSAGEPDFPTPAPIVEAAHQALRDERFGYTASAGLPELREAVAQKLRDENGLDVEAGQVVCSNGAKQAVAQSLLAVCAPGDEVVIPAPYWVSYPEMVRLAGAEPVAVEATAEAGYKVTPEQLDAAITERTRAVILNSPSNPTGAVYTASELEALAAVIRRHPRVLVVSDEIYEYVVFDADFQSFAALDGMAERTMTVNGFSKGFAMTGWRLGYLAGPPWWASAASKIQSQLTSGPNSITQYAALAAFTMGPEPVETMVAAFRERRDAVLARLRALDGVACPTPQGAFYLFPDVSSVYGRRAPGGAEVAGSVDLCTYLLDEHGVALVPGEAFGSDAGVRLSYATDLDTLMRACDRIGAGWEALR